MIWIKNSFVMARIDSSEITNVIYDDVMVRTGTVENDRGEQVELMVDIYESADTVRFHDLRTNTETHQPLQHTGSGSVKNRKPRASEVCLSLLCLSLLTTVIVLCVYFHQLLTHIKNLTEEREQIITNYTELILNQKNKLTEEREQIINTIVEFQRGHYEQVKCGDKFKWIYYNSSFYYISSEMKSWSYSRQYCQQRGADLLMIDSKEEQEFFQKFADHCSFWIGLTKNSSVWTWINGTRIANWYWDSGYYLDWSYYNCAVMTSSGWRDWSCTDVKKWICKRQILKSPIT